MTKSRFTQIGLDRLVRLVWLEQTSSLVLTNNTAKDVKAILQNELSGAFRSPGTDVRGSLDKTITVLLKVWLMVPAELESLRVGGLELLSRLKRRDHMAIHWGMVMAAYPFWSGVATQVGRLLRLQGSAAAAHVQRRIREQYGDRATVSRRTRYVLRSYLDWGVLQETGEKGIYSAGPHLAIEDSRLAAWLVEAFLCARTNGAIPLKELQDNPSLFPFRLKQIHTKSLMAAGANLGILHQGIDDELVMLHVRRQPNVGTEELFSKRRL